MVSTTPQMNLIQKQNIDVEQLFCVYLAQLIFTEDEIHSSKVWSYKPSELDEISRSELRSQIKIILKSPRNTTAYQYARSEKETEGDDINALLYVEWISLLVLMVLGDRKTVPTLLQFIKEHHKEFRARTTTSGFLYYVTGQNIGSYFLTNEDIDLWEEWWEQNKSALDKK